MLRTHRKHNNSGPSQTRHEWRGRTRDYQASPLLPLHVRYKLFPALGINPAALLTVRLGEIQLLWGRILEEHKLLDPVWNLTKAVCSMRAQRHCKHLIQFFERLPLGLPNKEEDQEPEDTTPGGIPPKGTLWFEGNDERRPCNGEHKVPEPGRRSGKRHPDVTNIEWESFGRVGKRNRTFSWGIKDRKEVCHASVRRNRCGRI